MDDSYQMHNKTIITHLNGVFFPSLTTLKQPSNTNDSDRHWLKCRFHFDLTAALTAQTGPQSAVLKPIWLIQSVHPPNPIWWWPPVT